ncbi:hypothetical protein LLE49_23075 [Alicyclobacillus tolerans]|uniref:hypothetical protein n=1 Tax=Alicyclobacillus tolerans TaxID=90970 RepID=UPI001F369E51|nr:hypothetical protein [Alicyclobacillus tolerans]MCF8567606.1 hypothetical protein [Alicyclobacillus tolerans]
MHIVWLGDGMEFPSHRLLKLLQNYGNVWGIRPLHVTTHPENLQTMFLDNWYRLESEEPSIVVVTHPLWVRTVVQNRPEHVIVLMMHEWPNDAIYSLCTKLLLSNADIIVTTSERTYLEQCLLRDGVFLWQSDDSTSHGVLVTGDETWFLKDCEVIVQSALRAVLFREDLKTVSVQQWRQRRSYYNQLLDRLGGPHETASFLLATYKYLLHESDARDQLLQAFGQMVTNGRRDCLRGQFRFLSAIQAQLDQLEEAIQTYGITALTAEERTNYRRLLDMYNADEERAVKAELYRLNDDLCTARTVLSNPQTNVETSLYVKILVETGSVQEALGIVASHTDRVGLSSAELHWIIGVECWRNRRSFEAMHEHLLAAASDFAFVQTMHDWAKMEDAIDSFVRGYSDGVTTYP